MKERQLKGKRFIALARCSSPGQIDTSIDEQLMLIEKFGRDQGMTCVGKVSLGGVTGSVPGVRGDVDELIKRKQQQNDFEVVVIQDPTRLTRSGPAHGLHIIHILRSVGVQIVSTKDNLPEGDMGDVMHTMAFYAGKEQAKGISFASTRGSAASLYEGKSAHCKAPPYGVDRLYTDENGLPKHVIRNLVDGTQVRLHPETGDVLETFGRNAKSGVPAHYHKQKSERIELVPGDQTHIAIVREIFERHLSDGDGYYRIAQDLNSRGVPSPRGKSWHVGQIRSILMNPIYLGVGIANLSTKAIYYIRSATGPVESPTTPEELAQGQPPRRIREQADWFRRDEPKLAALLDPAIQTLASVKQSARFDALAVGQAPTRNRDPHRDSSYILKGILTSRQGDYKMTGRTTGKKERPTRYYAVGRAFAAPNDDRVLRRLVPAESLEAAVLNALQGILTDCPHVHRLIRKLACDMLKEQSPETGIQELQREKASIEAKLSFVIDEMDNLSREAMRSKVKQLQGQLKDVTDQIRVKSHPQPAIDDPDGLADAVCERLNHLAEQIPTLPDSAIHQVLNFLVDKMVVDLDTREVEIVFALPDWATIDPQRLCLDDTLVCKHVNQTHRITMRRIRLCYERGHYGGCRRAA